MLTERFPELSHAWTAFTMNRCPERVGHMCQAHQLYPSPFKHVWKSCHIELCSSEADKMTRHHSLEQMTQSLVYKVGNPSILYCKQIIIWRLYFMDPAVIMGTSTCKLWLALAMSQKMTSKENTDAAAPFRILNERKAKYLKLCLIPSVQLGSGSQCGLFTFTKMMFCSMHLVSSDWYSLTHWEPGLQFLRPCSAAGRLDWSSRTIACRSTLSELLLAS